MALQFRFAQLDEYSKVSAFVNEYWAQNHVYCRSRDLFEWTFRRPDEWEHEGFSVVIAEDQGEPAGILGGIPFRFNRFGRTSRGVWIVNYVIRPDHRKGASALQLLSQFRRPEFDPVIAFGINPATKAIYQVLRGTVLDEIPRHFLVLPEASGRMADLLRLTYPDWPEDRARDLAESLVLRRRPAPSPEAIDLIPRTWDQEEWPAIAERTIGAARDSAYFTWRYRKHPVFEYRFVTAPEGARNGLAVWRLETIRRQTPEGRRDLDRIGRLVEFLPVSPANAEALLGTFVKDLRSVRRHRGRLLRVSQPDALPASGTRVQPDGATSGRLGPALAISTARRQGRRNPQRDVSADRLPSVRGFERLRLVLDEIRLRSGPAELRDRRSTCLPITFFAW